MNSDIMEWAHRNGVSHQALQELRAIMGTRPDTVVTSDARTEAGVQSRVRLAAAQAGYLVWRNNVGAMVDANGRIVRFGLANDSAAVNKRIKSSDLIGVKPNGQFWCRECKEPGWKYTGIDREQAQLRFIELVNQQGGDAAFSIGGI